ncbi:MAG: FAD-dependent oxidoreductase [Gemmatimonadetes bacterium]|nr:FAD-dependent oxidoreductase [Gemmatimonadota bacterium]
MTDPGVTPVHALSDGVWDALVIGGGIVGAGIFREAARAGLRVLLVEQSDFASGTSSRSSKLVHGGLHYLAQGQIRLSFRSQKARLRLLEAGTGLIHPLRFELSSDVAARLPVWLRRVLLRVYDGRRSAPGGGSAIGFVDGQTDDARLVLRVLREGRARGGTTLNYVRVERLLKDRAGRHVGALVTDRRTGRRSTLQARTIVGAVGFWSDGLSRPPSGAGPTKGLRGSHLVFPRHRLPLQWAVASVHRFSGRPVYALPWGPVTLVGSTSVPHSQSANSEPRIATDEAMHLFEWTRATFPARRLELEDIQATFSGVRAIPGRRTGERLAQASRAEYVHAESGLISVIGGKLTTFHTTAQQVLRLVFREVDRSGSLSATPPLDPLPIPWPGLPFDEIEAARLMALYGSDAVEAIAGARAAERAPLPGIGITAAEVRWVCATEHVRHLQDLLCRRFRTSILAPSGGLPWISRLRSVVCPVLGWSATRWEEEVDAYRRYWRLAHAPPRLGGLPVRTNVQWSMGPTAASA